MNNETITDILVKGLCFSKHPRHIIYFTSVPFANVLVERLVECKHVWHVFYIADISSL
jgi:hypothetical protein